MRNNISEETIRNNKIKLQKLEELIRFADGLLQKNPQRDLNDFNHKQSILFLTFGAVNNYTEAMLTLCRNSYPDAAIVLLRSLLEVFINIRYILDTNSDKRLILFHLEDARSRINFSTEMISFIKRYPNFISKENPLTDETFLNQEINKANEDIAVIKKHYKIKGGRLPNLLDKSKANDKKAKKNKGIFEYNYVTIYRFFSHYAHLTSRGLNTFLNQRPDGGYDLTTGKSMDIGPAVATTYGIYLFFLENLMKWKIIETHSLSKYIKTTKDFSKKSL